MSSVRSSALFHPRSRLRRRDLCLWLVLLAQGFWASAQVLNVAANPVQLADMDGLWRFHTGDNPIWAEPGFDDSQWPLVLPTAAWTIPRPAPSTITGWYRLHIVLPDSSEPFWLLLPQLPSSYQLFANGREFGHSGSPARLARTPVPRLFKIPADISHTRDLVLCVRVQYQPHLAWYAGPAGFHGLPMLGSASQTGEFFHLERVAAIDGEVSSFFVVFLCLLIAAVSSWFYLLRRSDRTYMWVAVYAVASAVFFGLVATLPLFAWPIVPTGLLFGGLNVLFAISEFQIAAHLLTPLIAEPPGRTRRILSRNYPQILVIVAAALIGAVDEMLVVDGGRSGLWNGLHSMLFLAVPISIFWLIGTSASKHRLRAWIFFAALTFVLGYFNVLGLVRKLPFVAQPVKDSLNGSFRSLILYPFPIGCWEASEILVVIALFAIIVDRFLRARGEKERIKIEAARLVQMV